MPEHRIKLRGGWEWLDSGSDPSVPRRSTLPVAWPPDRAGPIRLTRHFGRPPVDPSTETVRLEFRRVPGLRRLNLNGVVFEPPPGGLVDWDVPLVASLADRNTLILDVVPEGNSPIAMTEGWGAIALVIASRVEPGS